MRVFWSFNVDEEHQEQDEHGEHEEYMRILECIPLINKRVSP